MGNELTLKLNFSKVGFDALGHLERIRDSKRKKESERGVKYEPLRLS